MIKSTILLVSLISYCALGTKFLSRLWSDGWMCEVFWSLKHLLPIWRDHLQWPSRFLFVCTWMYARSYIRCAPTFCWTMIGKPRLYLRNSIHGFFKKLYVKKSFYHEIIVCKKILLSWNNSFSNAIFVKEYSFSKYILISFISWLEK